MIYGQRDKGFTLVEVALALLVMAIGVLAVFSLLSAGLDASARAVDDTHAAMFADSVFNSLKSLSLNWGEVEAKSNKWIVRHSWLCTNCAIHYPTAAVKQGVHTNNKPVNVWSNSWSVLANGGKTIKTVIYPTNISYLAGVWPSKKIWQGSKSTGKYVYEALPEVWVKKTDGSSPPYKYICTNYSFRTDSKTDIINHSLRYKLDVAVKTKKYVWNSANLRNYEGIYTNESYGDVGYIEGAAGSAISGTNYVPYFEVTLKVWPGEYGQTTGDKALVYYGEFENPGDL